MKLQDSVSGLSGVGEKRARALESLGIVTVEDLLRYYPRDYEDRSKIREIAELEPGRFAVVRGVIKETPRLSAYGGMKITRARIEDTSGTAEALWFNQPYIKNTIAPGKTYYLAGRVNERAGRIQIESPEFALADKGGLSFGRVIPAYSLPKDCGLSQKVLRKLILQALDECTEELAEHLPPETISRHGLMGLYEATRGVHYPESDEGFYKARERLVFDELLLLQLALSRLKQKIKTSSGFGLPLIDTDTIAAKLGFALTNAQARAVADIIGDMTSGLVMNRLVQGDVGSGKTAVAAIAAYQSLINGFQTAIMAPTEVLAAQHMDFFRSLFMEDDLAFLSGSVTGKAREEVNRRISSGQAKIVIGTHALFQDAVSFAGLALVITDEQHRFGVNQRLRLGEKGQRPHTLIMTATPIPRTLALITHGDMDITIIDELPPGRKRVDTHLVNSGYAERFYSFIDKQVAEGRQAYIICPAIEEEETLGLTAAASQYEFIAGRFPHRRAALLHGKMKPAEKESVMRGFAEGRIDILVSTTVVEVGISVKNATVMLILNSERFGLSQLHQLRGRVGRGAEKSYCILVTDSKSKLTKERMDIMTQTNDGFVIAETDLKLRGSGEFFGTRQSGMFVTKLANMTEDGEILKKAHAEAQAFISGKQPLPALLEYELSRFFGGAGVFSI